MNRRQRRAMSKDWENLFEIWRAETNKYAAGDAFNTINSFEIFENLDDDKSADVLIACDLFEHLSDPHEAMLKMKGLARKSVGFLLQPDEIRTAQVWKELIGRYFVVSGEPVQLAARKIFIAAACINTFGHSNGKVVAAGTPEGRWGNILYNMQAIKKRVQFTAVPHDRPAIIACYGPSIKDNMDPLMWRATNPKADIVSVSGAHDFLIGQEIVPNYHVECDPRPHKADNIAKGIEGVEYLLGALVNPVLTDKLQGQNIALWHQAGEFNRRIKDEYEPDATFVSGILNVGLTSLALFYRLGYRQFEIFGMDCSFKDGEVWAGPHAQKANQQPYRVVTVNCGGRQFQSSALYIAYANAFFDFRKHHADATYNIYGDSLLQQMACEYMKVQEAA